MFARYRRIVGGTIGALLVSAGLFTGYWWFYRLAPARRSLDPEWVASHSKREFWQETQERIRRGLWAHDDGFHVGFYGDKSWAEWIMARVEPGTRMDCFGTPCHSAIAMQYITNQDVGQKADDWRAWWEKNKAKTQAEWICDGFEQRGVVVDNPPTPEQIEALLGLLGETQADDAEADSDYVKYNAFRWLRDSGFQPVAYAVSNEGSLGRSKAGLLEYSEREARWPVACNIGILPLGKEEDEGLDQYLPLLLTPGFRMKAHAAIWLPFVLGVCLLAWSLWRGKGSARTT